MKRLFSFCLAVLLFFSIFNAPLTVYALDETSIASADVSILMSQRFGLQFAILESSL